MKKNKKSEREKWGGRSQKEVSDLIKKVRLSPEEKKEWDKMTDKMVDNLNKNVLKGE